MISAPPVRFIVSTAISALWVTHAAAGAQPITINDILKMEEVGNVEIAPDGQRIVLERIPPYEERGDYGIDEARLTGDLYVYEAAEQSTRLLLPKGNTTGRWIGGFSPRGSRLSIYWRENDGATKSGVFDFATDNLIVLPFTPYFGFAQATPIWVSEDELIYPTLSDGQQPSRAGFRQGAARRLADAWEKAWRGSQTTADVLSSTAKGADSPTRNGSLVRVNVHTGEVRTIATGLFVSLSLSPDRRYLAAVRHGELQQLDPGRPVRGDQGPYRFDAVVMDLEHNEAPNRICPDCEVALSTFEWSPSSQAVAFFARARNQSWDEATFQVFDLVKRQRLPVPHIGLDLVSERERGWRAIPEQAIPFGRGVAVPARAQTDPNAPPAFSDRPFRAAGLGRVDWYLVLPDGTSYNLTASLHDVSPVLVAATRDSLFVLANSDIWRVRSKGQPANLTTDVDATLTFSRRRDPEGFETRNLFTDVVVAHVLDAANPRIAFVDLARGVTTTLAVPANIGQLISVSPKTQSAVYRRGGNASHAVTAVFRDGRIRPLWTFNAHLSAVQPARQVKVTYALPGRGNTTSCALLPADWTPGKRAPVIVHVYPGAFPQCLTSYARGTVDLYEPEIFTSMGYIVLFPFAPEGLLRTSEGPLGNWAGMVLPAVDALIREGYADADRIGVFGLSYGSISVLSLLTQTNRFGAAVASHGAANFTSHYGTLGIVRRLWPTDLFAVGQSWYYESESSFLWLGPTPWDDPDRYVRASPFFEVEKIETPLLLMHSDLDWNYQMEQFDQVFTALFRLGKEAQYVRYWGEGHGLSSPANVRDMWERMEAWYGEHVKDRDRSVHAPQKPSP